MPRSPLTPADRYETLRQKILSVLRERTVSAKEISGEVSASEKEVYGHLDHIQKSLHHTSLTLVVVPSKCKKCGFSFKKRERLRKPGKCPICRSESISEPFFTIR